METFRFLQFKVYKDAKNYFNRILIISERINNYSFKDQIRRASLSIIEFARYLETSIASLNEVMACLDIINDLKKLNNNEYDKFCLESEEPAKQLGGFIKRLRVKS